MPKTCSCGVAIKQKYFKKCTHCKAIERAQKKEVHKLAKELRAIRKAKRRTIIELLTER